MSPNPVEAWEQAAVFEGLFVQALEGAASMRPQLKRLGVDLDRLEPRYPAVTFIAALDVASDTLFPQQPRWQGHRELGHRFVAGFVKTILGALLGAASSVVGPAGILRRFPGGFRRGRPDLEVSSREETPGHWRMCFRGAQISGPFTQGVLEGILRRAKIAPTVVLEPVDGGFDLSISWA